MTQSTSPRRARQEPTYRWCADYDRTHGPVAVKLATAYGMTPHEWQCLILDDWLALDSDGRLLNSMCVLEVPRQNGKTGVSDPRETYGLVIRGEWILHTAQEYQTAKKAFDRLREKFGTKKNDPYAKYPELNALVKNYTTSANQMVLDLTNGGHIEFRTRGSSGDAGRGGTFDLIVVDEAQSYDEKQDAALSPLNSAAPHGSPQTILMGTVPDPTNAAKGTVFARQRRTMHDAPIPGFCIHEWAADEIGDVADEGRWFETNPSLGKQLLVSALRKDAASMAPDTFAREHLGWWPSDTGIEPVITSDDWSACQTDEPPADGLMGVGVKFSPDGSRVSLAVCLRPETGNPYIEVVRSRDTSRGTRWVAEWLLVRRDKIASVAIDGKRGERTVQTLNDERFPKGALHVPGAQDVAKACSMLVDAVEARDVEHYGQPDLDAAATKCAKRKIGQDGFGFDDTDEGDSTLIEACALAYREAMTTKRNPARKLRVG